MNATCQSHDTYHVLPASSNPALGRPFLHQLRSLLCIVLPSLYTREALLLTAHSIFLVLRTVLSIAVARLDGCIIRDLVSADGKGFLTGLALWFALTIPSIYTNSMIRHLQSTLSLKFRTRLTRYIHDLYLSSAPHLRYYRIPLQGIDQYITADVEAWADSIAGIYGNLMKPSLDLLLFTSQLARSLGFRGTILLFINYYVTAKILRAVTPAFGHLAAVEARLEGEYRAGVGHIGRESEKIAFYNGGACERDILMRAYLRLINPCHTLIPTPTHTCVPDCVNTVLPAAPPSALVLNCQNLPAHSPTPPTRTIKSTYRGNLFTSDDVLYLKRYIDYCQEQGLVLRSQDR
ncbi:ABC transporter transmembrane region 2-domain-containing protein [Suillus ampliporus]|nr:ABC transporter transmembrane region 2-domain-containing protein [Suillus ampliporus]